MIDTFLQIILSNMVVSLGLAVVAMVVGLTIKRPRLTHLLWLLVLLKLVTPPVVTIPVAAIPAQIDQSIVSMEEYSQPGLIAPGTEENTASSIGLWLVELINHTNKVYLFWLLGSAFVLSLSLTRVYRFNNLLRKESRVAPDKYQSLATRIADQLGLKAIPTIYTTSAQLSPMVWWIGGEVRIVIPETLSDQMDTGQFQWILAHELAHVRRKDYIVRWIEWLVCVCFWWNPVVYWAKYYLRANEELCCDALVVSSLQLKPHSYADSLLKAFEYLASPIIRPPAMASEIYSGGFLKRRFSMIVSSNFTRSIPRWMLACVLLSAAVVLTLGFGCESGDPIANSGELARLNAVDRGDSNPERGRDRSEPNTDHFRRLGISSEMYSRIIGALNDGGIPREHIEPVMGGMLRIVYEINTEGEAFELDAGLRDYFKNRLRLTDEQIELVLGLARRVAYSRSESNQQ